MSRMNAMWNCKNHYQGQLPRVLCVCSAGLLRSPTIAAVMSKTGLYNVRAAGTNDYALVQVDDVLLHWADIIVFANTEHERKCWQDFPGYADKTFYTLAVEDVYSFMDKKLVKIVKTKLKDFGFEGFKKNTKEKANDA